MSKQILPSSPNWYCTKVSDCTKSGFLCYGAKNGLCILDVNSVPPLFLGNIFNAHKERIVGLSLCGESSGVKCCSIGDDKYVKVWNLDSHLLIAEHKKHQDALAAVDWSTYDPGLIVSGDEKGNLVLWKINTNKFQMLQPEFSPVNCLAWSPHQSMILAVGYKSSAVLVLDVSQSSCVLNRFKGHDEDIHTVCWCPTMPPHTSKQNGDSDVDDESNDMSQTVCKLVLDSEVERNEKYPLLCSSSRDRTIRVWSITKDRVVSTIKLPHTTGRRRAVQDDFIKSKLWLTLNWPQNRPNTILSSSYNGDILAWDISNLENPQWQVFTAGQRGWNHTRIVFNICVGGANLNTICTLSQDRQLILWDMSTRKSISVVPTLGGFVYSLAQSSMNPGLLAIGVGDNMLRVWNLQNPETQLQTFWQGIKSKITAVAWHPAKEGILAYGTDDGRIGMYDVLCFKPPKVFSVSHRRTVYVLAWGPSCTAKGIEGRSEEQFYLYSVGDGKILMHNPKTLDADPQAVNTVIQEANNNQTSVPTRSEISFKPGFKNMAIGSDDGSVEIYKMCSMLLVCRVHVVRKLINCVRWHPDYTAQSRKISECCYWIAIGSNDSTIHVVDLRRILGSEHISDQPLFITESFCQLSGHGGRITNLAWSPHEDGKLVSTSYDHTAQIWNVKTGQPLANFRQHSGRLFSVVWCLQDPDVIYTGGEDYILQSWRISEQQDKTPPTATERRKTKAAMKSTHQRQKPRLTERGTSATKASASPLRETEVDEESEAEVSMPQLGQVGDTENILRPKKEQILQEHCRIVADLIETSSSTLYPGATIDANSSKNNAALRPLLSQAEAETFASKKDSKDRKKRKPKSLFPVSGQLDQRSKQAMQDDCIELVNVQFSESTEHLPDEKSYLGCFLDRRGTYDLFRLEGDHHRQHGQAEQHALLETFKGDFDFLLQEAATKDKLNDWLMMLAPAASLKTWRQLCTQYAVQLEGEGHWHKAAACYLATNQVYEAIEMFKRNNMFKEAVCLGRVRLSPEDPVQTDLFSSWANHLSHSGNYELAAKCLLAIKKPIEAARLLVKRSELSALKTAVHITLISNEMEAAELYGRKFIRACQLNCDWLAAAKVGDLHECFKKYTLSSIVHEVLFREMSGKGLIDPGSMEGAHSAFKPGNRTSKIPLPKFLMKSEDVDEWLPWQGWTVEGEVFVLYVLRQWHILDAINFKKGKHLLKLYDELSALQQSNQEQISFDQILVDVCVEVSLGILQLICGDVEYTARHWLSALSACEKGGHYKISVALCRFLMPRGPTRLLKLQNETQALLTSVYHDYECLAYLNERKSSIPSCVDTTDAFDEKASKFHTNATICYSTDCLKAYFYECVLRFLINACGTSGAGFDEECLRQQELSESCYFQGNAVIESFKLKTDKEAQSIESKSNKGTDKVVFDQTAQEWGTAVSETKTCDEDSVHVNSASQYLCNLPQSQKNLSVQKPLKEKENDENDQLAANGKTVFDEKKENKYFEGATPNTVSVEFCTKESEGFTEASRMPKTESECSVVRQRLSPNVFITDKTLQDPVLETVRRDTADIPNFLSTSDMPTRNNNNTQLNSSETNFEKGDSQEFNPSRECCDQTKVSDGKPLVCLENLQTISRGLLWDLQARRFFLREASSYIQNAVTTLISRHTTENRVSEKETCHSVTVANADNLMPKYDAYNKTRKNISSVKLFEKDQTRFEESRISSSSQKSNSSTFLALDISNTLERRLSGDYVDMSFGSGKTLKPHELIPISPIKLHHHPLIRTDSSLSEDFVEMHEETEECSEACRAHPVTNKSFAGRDSLKSAGSPTAELHAVDNDSSTLSSVDNQPEDEIPLLDSVISNADVFSKSDKSVSNSHNLISTQACLSDKDASLLAGNPQKERELPEIVSNVITTLKFNRDESVCISNKDQSAEGENTPEMQSRKAGSLTLPAEWYGLYPDQKYCHESVTLPVLTSEQQILMDELVELEEKLKNFPFPNPLQSAELLINAATLYLGNQADTMVKAVCKWGIRNAHSDEIAADFRKILNAQTHQGNS